MYQHGLDVVVYGLFRLKMMLNPIKQSIVAVAIHVEVEGHHPSKVYSYLLPKQQLIHNLICKLPSNTTCDVIDIGVQANLEMYPIEPILKPQ